MEPRQLAAQASRVYRLYLAVHVLERQQHLRRQQTPCSSGPGAALCALKCSCGCQRASSLQVP
jgi:hypothetical protein